MTRDASRIPEVLEALRKAWEASPDLRLGQLITGAVDAFSQRGGTIFYLDDVDMKQALENVTPEPEPKHVHSFWTVQWLEEGLLQDCSDSMCHERRMVPYR
jgi:hypothetical protein